jgi:tetratricopeptide (TPR) repeat protein
VPEYAAAHLGLANACLMRFETTRADPAPDGDALARAVHHARDACRLDPASAEAWALLGFVLGRTTHRLDALAAANRATALEPDNWRHQFRLVRRLGEARLRGASNAGVLPSSRSHWLAATVYVARRGLNDGSPAAGLAGLARTIRRGGAPLAARARYLARETTTGLAEFERNWRTKARAHHECCSNTWYAIGALRARQGRAQEAVDAFGQALDRVASHPMALAALNRDPIGVADSNNLSLAGAIRLAIGGAHAGAARSVADALAAADEGNAFWLLPVEPILHVTARADVWAEPLARLRSRAA